MKVMGEVGLAYQGTEVSYQGYARQPVLCEVEGPFPAPGSRVKVLDEIGIRFPKSTGGESFIADEAIVVVRGCALTVPLSTRYCPGASLQFVDGSTVGRKAS